jgi:hypothetical protein
MGFIGKTSQKMAKDLSVWQILTGTAFKREKV